jgi:hypothetical protein
MLLQAAAARRALDATLTTAKKLHSCRKDASVFADVLAELVRTQLDSLAAGATAVVPAGWAYEKGLPHTHVHARACTRAHTPGELGCGVQKSRAVSRSRTLQTRRCRS